MDGKWDLSCLYQSFDDPKLSADLAALPEVIRELTALAQGEAPERERLIEIVALGEKLDTLIGDLYGYAELNLAVDSENTQALQLVGRLEPVLNEARLAGSAVTRFIGSIENLEGMIASSQELQAVAFYLRDAKRQCAHLPESAIEPWLLDMQLSGGTAFSHLRDQLDASLTVDLNGEQLPLSAVRGMAYDPDAKVRKEAYEAEIASYKKIDLPMSACLNAIKMEARTMAKACGYASVLDMTLDNSRMERRTLDALWTAAQEYLPHFRRYMQAKARLLGHEGGLPFYDLFAPIGNSAKVYSIEECREILQREMGKFTPDMAVFIGKAFDESWIDLYPRVGKAGGAFCAGLHGHGRSAVMTNFQGSFSDISTIAHELGHAWHNHCMDGLPECMCNVPMQLAETASIFNETMLSYQVLASCSREDQLTLLESSLMEATQTVVDIYSRFLFESEVVETRADHTMTVDELKDAMLRAQDASYGDGLAAEIRHPYMWACKSHYYSSGLNFYNFPYAFGLLFAKGVFAKYLEKGDAFVPEYCALLRNCGNGSVEEVAASVGINVTDVNFWRSSLEVIRRDIDTFCELCKA